MLLEVAQIDRSKINSSILKRSFFMNKQKEDEFLTQSQLLALIRWAYRKLKLVVYYDNSQLFLREKISQFEDEKIESKLKAISKMIMTYSKEGNFEKYLNEISYYCLPKKVSLQKEKESNIIRNFTEGKSEVNKVTYYIDLPVEGHILGVLWILLVGGELQKKYKDFAYGNILYDSFQQNHNKLFRPYFKQYEKWRDKAIRKVEELKNNEQQSMLIALDIKDYYYSANVSFRKLKEDIFNKNTYININSALLIEDSESNHEKGQEKIKIDELAKELTVWIENVFSEYSKKILDDNKKEDKRVMIPIGFLPSNIIANWYIYEFDKAVQQKINPAYYGRYVDDIIIVIKKNGFEEEYKNIDQFIQDKMCMYKLLDKRYMVVENNRVKYKEPRSLLELAKCIPYDEIETKKVLGEILKEKEVNQKIHDIFGKHTETDINWNCKRENIFKLTFRKCLKSIKNKEDREWDKLQENILNKFFVKIKFAGKEIKKVYVFSIDKNLAIQSEKIRLYDFKHTGDESIINHFKEELKRNASVFKYLPEKGNVLEAFEKEIYKIDFSEGENKIRSIENIEINKYNLSKILAQLLYFDSVDHTDDVIDIILGKIVKIFKDNNAIKFWMFWEKVLLYFLITENKGKIFELVNSLNKAINDISIELDFFQNYRVKIEKEKIREKIKKGLKLHFKIALSMVYALDDKLLIDLNMKTDNAFKCILDEKKYKDDLGIRKEQFRRSNMLRHQYVTESLLNYTKLVIDKSKREKIKIEKLSLNKSQYEGRKSNNGFRCNVLNPIYKIQECEYRKNNICCDMKEDVFCMYGIHEEAKKYTPRFVHLHECILYHINLAMAQGKVLRNGEYIKEAYKLYQEINNLEDNKINKSNEDTINKYILKGEEIKAEETKIEDIEKTNLPIEYVEHLKETEDELIRQKIANINFVGIANEEVLNKLKIAIVHMKINAENLEESFKKTPILSKERKEELFSLLNRAVKKGAEMIIFPEVSIPYIWLKQIVNFARKRQVAIVCGLEHIIYENQLACNYLATILPEKKIREDLMTTNSKKYEYYTSAIVKLRLKNHYSPNEEKWVRGFGWINPTEQKEINLKVNPKAYDLFIWRGIYFACYSCFELADIRDRSIFASHVDLIIGCVHNKDLHYYEAIMDSLSRDIHCYFAHVNNATLGDNRISQPSKTIEKNILQISKGINNTVLLGEIDIKKLREFQRLKYELQLDKKVFKPTPPKFQRHNVIARMNKPR